MATMGRPRTDNPRDITTHVRWTSAEHALIAAAAQRAGQPLGEWLRTRAINAAKRQR